MEELEETLPVLLFGRCQALREIRVAPEELNWPLVDKLRDICKSLYQLQHTSVTCTRLSSSWCKSLGDERLTSVKELFRVNSRLEEIDLIVSERDGKILVLREGLEGIKVREKDVKTFVLGEALRRNKEGGAPSLHGKSKHKMS